MLEVVSMIIDTFMPYYEFSEVHSIEVDAYPQKAFDALQDIDFTDSFLIKALFWLRGLNSSHFQDFKKHFVVLEDNSPHEIVLGMVARPWKVKGDLRKVFKDDFLSFNEPGYAKMTWNFSFEEKGSGTKVTTETRILCTDKASKRKFGLYWFFIRHFSGLTRKEMLRLLRARFENYS